MKEMTHQAVKTRRGRNMLIGASVLLLAIIAGVLAIRSSTPRESPSTQALIIKTIDAHSDQFRDGFRGSDLRVGTGTGSGTLGITEFEFVPATRNGSVGFRFYCNRLGRCQGTYGKKYVSFNVLGDYRHWSLIALPDLHTKATSVAGKWIVAAMSRTQRKEILKPDKHSALVVVHRADGTCTMSNSSNIMFRGRYTFTNGVLTTTEDPPELIETGYAVDSTTHNL